MATTIPATRLALNFVAAFGTSMYASSQDNMWTLSMAGLGSVLSGCIFLGMEKWKGIDVSESWKLTVPLVVLYWVLFVLFHKYIDPIRPLSGSFMRAFYWAVMASTLDAFMAEWLVASG